LLPGAIIITAMYSFLLKPRWLIATSLVVILAGLFVNLGLWQLRRLDEARQANQLLEARLELPTEDFEVMLQAVGEDLAAIEYHPVTVDGVFDRSGEVLLRSRTLDGVAGFHVVTPLVTEGGDAVLVNRGWVPLEMDQPPVPAAPPDGEVVVEGLVRLSQERPGLGPADPAEGNLALLSRLDIPRIQQQTETELAPVSVDLTSVDPATSGDLPVPVGPPPTDDEGNHLAYAIQWFAFMVVGVVGYVILVRRRARSGDA
jgi:surfeit locus 1 family protein